MYQFVFYPPGTSLSTVSALRHSAHLKILHECVQYLASKHAQSSESSKTYWQQNLLAASLICDLEIDEFGAYLLLKVLYCDIWYSFISYSLQTIYKGRGESNHSGHALING